MPNEFDPYYKWLGIPSKDQPPNYYRLLGINLFESDQNVIDNAANQRCHYIQSFLTGDNAAMAEKIRKEIIVAGVCLLTPKKKIKYDSDLKQILYSIQQDAEDSTDVSMAFIEPEKISKIIRAPRTNKYSESWPALVGVLMLAGIIVIIIAINKNLQVITNPRSNEQNSNHTVSDKTYNSRSSIVPPQVPKPSAPRPIKEAKAPVKSEKPQKGATLVDLERENDSKEDDPQRLERQPPPEIQPDNPSVQNGIPLDILPSGKKFDPDIFDIEIEEVINRLNNSLNNQQLIILHYPDGLAALVMHRGGILDGVCVAIGEKGTPITFANYKDGRLDGVIETWNEKGERIYCCQYANGFRNGFCCYYKDNQFKLLLEIYRDTIRGIYCIGTRKLEKCFDFSKQDDMDENTKKLFQESRSALYTSFNRNENNFKKQFNAEYLRLQVELASIMKSKGLNAVQNRIKEYNNECQKIIDNLRHNGAWNKSVW